MDPDGWLGPDRCAKGRVPRRGHGARVDRSAESFQRGAGRIVPHGQWHTAKEVVLTRWRPVQRVDSMEGGNEPRQGSYHLARIGDAVDGRGLALEPAVHRPLPGIVLGG